jgi:hypothetical protein
MSDSYGMTESKQEFLFLLLWWSALICYKSTSGQEG